MKTLKLTPDKSSYKFIQSDNILRVELEGGFSRSRLDLVGGTKQVDALWTLDKLNYEYFTAFYIAGVSGGADWFYIDLVLNSKDVETVSAKFVEGSVNLSYFGGFIYQIEATLEVIENAHSDSSQQFIIDHFYDEPIAAGASIDLTFTEEDHLQYVDLLYYVINNDDSDLIVSNVVTYNDPNDLIVDRRNGVIRINTGRYKNLNLGESQVITVSYTISNDTISTLDQVATITITGIAGESNVAGIIANGSWDDTLYWNDTDTWNVPGIIANGSWDDSLYWNDKDIWID